MTIGYIGCTSLAGTIVKNLITSGVNVVLFDENPKAVEELIAKIGTKKVGENGICIPTYTLIDFMKQNPPPRTIVFQVSDAKSIDTLIDKLLAAGIAQGDIFVDIGRTDANITLKRYKDMKQIGCGFIDCGLLYDRASGAMRLTVGGDETAVAQLSGLWSGITGPGGWKYAGASGKGHDAAYTTRK